MPATLFFDTETTGKAEFNSPVIDRAQPKIVQLAAILRDDETKREMASLNVIVEPRDWTIDPGAEKVHGISVAVAKQFGVDHHRTVDLMLDLMEKADTIVAHNIRFDSLVLRHALYLYAQDQPGEATHAEIFAALSKNLDRMRPRCTMLAAVPVVKILHQRPRHPADFKWPKLEECVRYFFDESLDGAHDALVDVRACIRVYDELEKRQAFDHLEQKAI